MVAHYRLVFRGKYLPGFSEAEVKANLVRLFNVPTARVDELLTARPAVIKQSVNIEAGNRYLDTLLEAGLITHLELLESGDGTEAPVVASWDGIERRQGERRGKKRDRRDVRRGAAIQPDRRNRGRRKTD